MSYQSNGHSPLDTTLYVLLFIGSVYVYQFYAFILGNILVEDVRFPRNVNISSEARDLLLGLLVKDPARRLGGGPSDAQEIRSHLFFSVFNESDWEALEQKRVS